VNVDVIYRNDPERPLTDPVLEPGGRRFVVRVYRGDFLDIIGGTWFDPAKPPRKVIRARLPVMVFVAWRWPDFMRKSGYCGFKLYGVDSDNYKKFIDQAEVYVGSQACHLSFRPFADNDIKAKLELAEAITALAKSVEERKTTFERIEDALTELDRTRRQP